MRASVARLTSRSRRRGSTSRPVSLALMAAPSPSATAMRVPFGVSPVAVTSTASTISGSNVKAAGPAPRRPSSSCTVNMNAISCGEFFSRRIVSIRMATPMRSSMLFDIRRLPPSSAKAPTKPPTSPTLTGTSAARETPKSTYRSVRAGMWLGLSRRDSTPMAPMAPLVKRTRLPAAYSGRTPPTLVTRAKPRASMWLTIRPISSMCAASATLRPPRPRPLRIAIRLPMGSTVTESANPAISERTRSRTASS